MKLLNCSPSYEYAAEPFLTGVEDVIRVRPPVECSPMPGK